MTATRELPPSAEKHPARYLLHPLRPLAGWVVRRRYDVRVVDGDKVPAKGPVIIASNHVGVLDGPLLAIFAPRPVHALTKEEMFRGKTGGFLLRSGQIPLDRFHPDPLALKRCLRVLRDGGAIGIFPEGARGSGEFERFHTGAAYLAMVTGAPIVPVVQIGTREPGGSNSSLPTKGALIEMVYGDPIHLSKRPWPRTKGEVAAASVSLRAQFRDHLAKALATTGRTLPGPLPAADAAREAAVDPDTAVTDQEEAS
jgi:1-acyl-sn-glycerol-3-phosphate acyltransferase